MKQIDVQSAGLTDKGKLRSDNQDQFLVADLTRSVIVRSGSLELEQGARLFGRSMGHLFLVADGMGGHRGGNEASKFAVQFCANAILNSRNWVASVGLSNEDLFVDDLKSMLEKAHQAIEDRSKTTDGFEGMGTTLTMAYVDWPRMFIAHAGDTRCYLFRNNELRLVTRDHTVANEMMKNGQLDPEELERSHWSNVLVNALGAGARSVYPDIYKLDLQPNDSIILCSDGLNKHVSDLQIRRTLTALSDPQRICEELVSLAKQGGGSDNITVVMAKFFEQESQNNRMQMFIAPPSQEILLQDLRIPESELDTHDDEPSLHATVEFDSDGREGDAKDTVDFDENGDGPSGEFHDENNKTSG